MNEADVILVRHGAPADYPPGIFLGRTDPSLDAVGRQHADELAEELAAHLPPAELGGIWSSPLLRARETADPIAARFQVDVQVADALRELDFGAWETRRIDHVRTEEPEALNAWMANPIDRRPPDGESFVDLAERLQPWFEQLTDIEGVQIVVAHYGSLAVLAALLLEAPLGMATRLRLSRGQAARIDRGSLRWWGMPLGVHTPHLGRPSR